MGSSKRAGIGKHHPKGRMPTDEPAARQKTTGTHGRRDEIDRPKASTRGPARDHDEDAQRTRRRNRQGHTLH